MNIVHVILSLDPAFGGTAAVVSRLAPAQAALGHDVHVVAYTSAEARERTTKALHSVPGWDEVTLHDAGPMTRLQRIGATSAQGIIRDLAADADIIHAHGAWSSSTVAAAREARRARTPYVICPHGMLDPWCMAQSAMKKQIALSLTFRRIFNDAAFIHALNADERDLMAPLGLTAPVEIIPNGVFLEEFADLPASGTFRSQHPEIGEAPFVLFLSRLHHKKGLDHLADAFALVVKANPSLHLVVAGPDGGARQPFEHQVRDLGIADHVHLTGSVYGPDKLAALVDAACFCLPSRQEGFSIAITEALACGLPVVASEACHFPELAESGAGEVVPLEPAAIADALLRVMSTPDTRSTMGSQGKALVRDRFNWPVIARRSVDCYAAHVAQGDRL